MSGINRVDIKAGARVLVVRKEDQRTGKLTEGCNGRPAADLSANLRD